MRIKTNPGILIAAFLVFCLLLCGACKKEEAAMTPTKLVREIFGRPEKVEDSGVFPNQPAFVAFYPVKYR